MSYDLTEKQIANRIKEIRKAIHNGPVPYTWMQELYSLERAQIGRQQQQPKGSEG